VLKWALSPKGRVKLKVFEGKVLRKYLNKRDEKQEEDRRNI
jgi:hypothetical protein